MDNTSALPTCPQPQQQTQKIDHQLDVRKVALPQTGPTVIKSPTDFSEEAKYFSLIDPKASDLSYATITDHPYLYYVRMDDNHGPYQRILFRQPVRLDWLIKTATAHQAAPRQ